VDERPVEVGLRPWLPGALGRMRWLTGTVPAERLAALRIGTALVLLLDTLGTYLPDFQALYGPGSFSDPDVFAERFAAPHWCWSVLRVLPADWGPWAAFGVWVAAAVALLVGYRPQLAAAVAWALAVSFWNSNYYAHNGGDRLRHFLLLVLALSPCGAAWSVRRPRGLPAGRPVEVPAWPVTLALTQLCVMYFFNGINKLPWPAWRDGSMMAYTANDLAWSRWSMAGWPIPFVAGQVLTWGTLVWEAGFPILLLTPGTRRLALGLGVFFHVLTGLHLEIGTFALYSLCLYLPLVPWERLRRGGRPRAAPVK